MALKRKDMVTRKSDVSKFDTGIKNPWLWSWLEKQVDRTSLGSIIEKIAKPGFAICKICNKDLNYSNRECVALEDHVKGAKHKQLVQIQKTNYALPGICSILNLFLLKIIGKMVIAIILLCLLKVKLKYTFMNRPIAVAKDMDKPKPILLILKSLEMNFEDDIKK